MPKIIVIPSSRFVRPPSIPTLTATAVSETTIALAAQSVPGDDQSITAYQFERSPSAGGPWTIIATQASGSYSDGSLSGGQTRYYRVIATQSDAQQSGYSATASATTSAQDDYPRLGTLWIGGPRDYQSATNQKLLAMHQINILGWFPGSEQSIGTTMSAVIQGARALSPYASQRYYQYARLNENELTGSTYSEARDKLNAESWWLYQSGGGGTIVGSLYDPSGQGEVNLTSAVPADGEGLKANQWMARHAKRLYIDGYFSASPNRPSACPDLDGIYFDNNFPKPRGNPAQVKDWDRNGTADSNDDPTTIANWHAGYKGGVDYLKSIDTRLVGCNLVDYFDDVAQATNDGPPLDLSIVALALDQRYEFGSAGGFDSFKEQYRSTAQIKDYFARLSSYMTGIKGLVVQFGGLISSSTDYAQYRFGLALVTVLSDFYFYASEPGSGDGGGAPVWFDEMAVDVATRTAVPFASSASTLGAARKWFGAPIDPAQHSSSAWQSGVYRRRFTNGWALWNPRGNGSQTVALGQTMRKLTGSLETSVNNGASVSSVTLPDRSGLFLLN